MPDELVTRAPQGPHADALKRSEESGDRCKKYESGSDIRQYGEKGT